MTDTTSSPAPGSVGERATRRLPILPVPAVVMPGTVLTLTLESDAAQAAVRAAQAGDGRVLLLAEAGGDLGVVGAVPNTGSLPGGQLAAIIQAETRARVVQTHVGERSGTVRRGRAARRPAPDAARRRGDARAARRAGGDRQAARQPPPARRSCGPSASPARWSTPSPRGARPSRTTRLRSCAPSTSRTRVALATEWAKAHLAELQVTAQIRADVTEGMDKQQREFLLRQQMQAIRKELGEGDDDVVEEYRTKLAAAELPEKAFNAVAKEIDRLERTSQQSPEHAWIRTWLDRIFEMPWNVRTDDRLDLGAAREVLDADHYGLDDVKDRIVEFLAVRKLRARPSGGRRRHRRGQDGHGPFRRFGAHARRVRQASARRRSPSPSPGRWAATSCACRSAACVTRPRSAATDAPTSAASRAASSGRSWRPGA